MKNQWMTPTSKPVIESVRWRFLKTSKVPVKKPVDIHHVVILRYTVYQVLDPDINQSMVSFNL